MIESGFSGGKFHLLEKIGERRVQSFEGLSAARRSRRLKRGGGAQRTGVEADVEHRHASPEQGDAIPVAVWDALDESMESQSTQVVGHLAGGVGLGIAPEELGHVGPHVAMPEAGGR